MSNTKLSPAEIESRLNYYCGTEKYTRHFTRSLWMTDGILAMRELCDAFWLTDIVASVQTDELMKKCDNFQVWTVEKTGPNSGVVKCMRDIGAKPVYIQELEYTDFPLDSFKFYVQPAYVSSEVESTPLMMLTSEY